MLFSQPSSLFRSSRQPSEPPNTFYSIYQSQNAIEIRSGCTDYKELRLISSCLCYEQACEIAQTMANVKQMPIKNLV